MLNAEAPWDAFDPRAYFDHNYRDVLAADAEIVQLVGRHFSDHFRGNFDRPVLGIDVGAGANLYPALSMLPWCHEITLLERSPKNVDYLKRQKRHCDLDWDRFWKLLCDEDEAYARIDGDRRERFRKAVRVREADLFGLESESLLDLRPSQGRWQIGTMFFVAESMSTSHEEFETRGRVLHARPRAGGSFRRRLHGGVEGVHVGEPFLPGVRRERVAGGGNPRRVRGEGREDTATAGRTCGPATTGIIVALRSPQNGFRRFRPFWPSG